MDASSAADKKLPVRFELAVIVFAFTFAAILCEIKFLGTSAYMPLVLAVCVASIGGIVSGYKWYEIEDGISETIKASAPAILIMLIIGMVIGTWILGGIVPTMIYYGLSWISSKLFLVTACLLCTLAATFTGSS